MQAGRRHLADFVFAFREIESRLDPLDEFRRDDICAALLATDPGAIGFAGWAVEPEASLSGAGCQVPRRRPTRRAT